MYVPMILSNLRLDMAGDIWYGILEMYAQIQKELGHVFFLVCNYIWNANLYPRHHPWWPWAIVRSQAAIVVYSFFVVSPIVLVLSCGLLRNNLAEEEIAGCFALDCVVVVCILGAMDWSAVCHTHLLFSVTWS